MKAYITYFLITGFVIAPNKLERQVLTKGVVLEQVIPCCPNNQLLQASKALLLTGYKGDPTVSDNEKMRLALKQMYNENPELVLVNPTDVATAIAWHYDLNREETDPEIDYGYLSNLADRLIGIFGTSFTKAENIDRVLTMALVRALPMCGNGLRQTRTHSLFIKELFEIQYFANRLCYPRRKLVAVLPEYNNASELIRKLNDSRVDSCVTVQLTTKEVPDTCGVNILAQLKEENPSTYFKYYHSVQDFNSDVQKQKIVRVYAFHIMHPDPKTIWFPFSSSGKDFRLQFHDKLDGIQTWLAEGRQIKVGIQQLYKRTKQIASEEMYNKKCHELIEFMISELKNTAAIKYAFGADGELFPLIILVPKHE